MVTFTRTILSCVDTGLATGDGTEELYVLNTGNLGGDEHIGDHIFKRQFKRRKGDFTHVPFYTDLLQHRYDNYSKVKSQSLQSC